MYDCASYYKNEHIVGEAIAQLKTPRSDIFVISKVWWDEVEDCEAACRRSLKNLGVEYVDLYLVHWPFCLNPATNEMVKLPMYKIWAQMEALVDKGLVKSIGVSNFNVQSLLDMLTYCRIKPVVNEVELHPYCVQDSLVKFMKQYEIIPIAYCPVARGIETSNKIVNHQNIFESPVIS